MKKNELKQVVIDQQEELRRQIAGLQSREQLGDLPELVSRSKLVKVVLGIRRCGKSSLCAHALAGKRFLYVNFDDERLVGLSAANLNSLLSVLKELDPECTTFLFDEIQNIEHWELFVNRLQRTGYNLVVTGSNGKLLGRELATHLTGREISLILYPLTFREFLRWRGFPLESFVLGQATSDDLSRVASLFEDYTQSGGFPEVVLGEPRLLYVRELFDKIITRDIVQRYGLRDIRQIKAIAAYLLQSSGSRVSYEKLRSTFGLKSLVTTRKYVQHLLDVFLIHEVKGYSYKLRARSTSPRKVYASDLTMMRALWTKPTQDLGAQLETIVYLHLLAQKREVYYLMHQGREVDFCIMHQDKPGHLIQVCYELESPKTRERELRVLGELAEMYDVNELTIVTRDERDEYVIGGRTVQVVPVYEFLLT